MKYEEINIHFKTIFYYLKKKIYLNFLNNYFENLLFLKN